MLIAPAPTAPLFADLAGGQRRSTTQALPESHADSVRADAFLTEVAASFEMTQRGWHEVVDRLHKLNAMLERQVADRTANNPAHRFFHHEQLFGRPQTTLPEPVNQERDRIEAPSFNAALTVTATCMAR